MKLGKEEIQKLALGVILFVALIYGYFALLLGPLQDSHAASRKAIEEAKAKLADAKAQIVRAEKLKTTAPAAKLMVKQISAMIPDGSPVAWFPIRVSDFFRQYGLEKLQTHLAGDVADRELTNFRMTTWTIDIPNADFAAMGQALAAFENQELLVEVTHLDIEYLKDDPETQHVTLAVNNVVKP